MRRTIKSVSKAVYISIGGISLALGVVGIFLPLLPTTPFLLLSAFFFSKGSDKFYAWLVEHPQLGPPINDWNQHGSVRLKYKITATAMLTISAFYIFFMSHSPVFGKVGFSAVAVSVLLFLWSRPSDPKYLNQNPDFD